MSAAGSSAPRLAWVAAIAYAVTPVLLVAPMSAQAASARAAGASATCTSSGLVVWLDTQGSGAAGSSYYHLEFTNLSRHACVLLGYPGVSAIDLGGHRIGSPASRNAVHGPHTLTLAPGATATAVLQIVQAGNFPGSMCRQVSAAGLRVYPPNQTAAKIVPFPFHACSRTGPVYLTVEAVQKA